MPLNDLGKLGLVRAKGVRVDETTERVSTLVSTVGVHLSSTIIRGHVDLGLVNVTNNLDIVGSLHKLDTSKGAGGNQASAAAGLGAPCNSLALRVANNRIGFRRSPNAKV